MTETEPEKERRFWVVDPRLYERHARESFPLFFLRSARTLGRYAAWGALFAYPLILVYLGLAFGWLGFWGSFLLSLLILGLALTRAGYAGNFQSWDPSLARQFVGLVLGFAIAVGFYEGLFILKWWLLPLLLGILLAGLAYKLSR